MKLASKVLFVVSAVVFIWALTIRTTLPSDKPKAMPNEMPDRVFSKKRLDKRRNLLLTSGLLLLGGITFRLLYKNATAE